MSKYSNLFCCISVYLCIVSNKSCNGSRADQITTIRTPTMSNGNRKVTCK